MLCIHNIMRVAFNGTTSTEIKFNYGMGPSNYVQKCHKHVILQTQSMHDNITGLKCYTLLCKYLPIAKILQ